MNGTFSTTLSRHFGIQSTLRASIFATSLLSSTSNSDSRVLDYVAHWHAGVVHLHSVKFPLSNHLSLYYFVQGLPNSVAFSTLLSLLPQHLEKMKDDNIGTSPDSPVAQHF